MPAAIHYTPIPPEPAKVTGLHVAVDSIVRAIARHAQGPDLYCVTGAESGFASFRRIAGEAGRSEARCIHLRPHEPARLKDVGCLFRPDPDIARLAWPRRAVGQRSYSLCGLAHTMSTPDVAAVVADAAIAPMQDWDAIVCPSAAIKSAIERLWEGWADYLAVRVGARPDIPVRLPVIPLGVDAARFAKLGASALRSEQRDRLGVDQRTLVVLYHGRLSFYAKAHPYPMMAAAERAAVLTGRPVLFVLYGWFAPGNRLEEYEALGAGTCRTASIRFVSNDDPTFPDALWAAADVFLSLSDNVQESFGLAPLEAMAAGLPCVVSDWDGYRDSVRDGVDGFRVPTATPPPGTGALLGNRLATGEDTYGHFLSGASLATAVDIDAAATALARLADDPALRARMGAAARDRAASTFDWARIVASYNALWNELAERRRSAAEAVAAGPGASAADPRCPDPFVMFAGFPTRSFADDDRIDVVEGGVELLARLLANRMTLFASAPFLDAAKIPVLVARLRARAESRLGDHLGRYPEAERAAALRTIAWLAKLGVVRIRPADRR